MMLRFFSIISVCAIMLSCNQANQSAAETVEKDNSSSLTEADIAKLKYTDFALDQNVEALAEPWMGYSRLKETVTAVKSGDFSLLRDNEKASTELIRELKKTVPDTLNTQAVLSRILVIETMLKKMQETSSLSTTTKSELSDATKAFLEAFSNLNFQLNKKLEKERRKIVRP